MEHSADELRAILSTYQQVAAAWPDLNPSMKSRAGRWATASAADLRAELDGYVREVAPPRSQVRLVWKTGPKYLYAGCNELFAKDAGMALSDMVGIDDFHPVVHERTLGSPDVQAASLTQALRHAEDVAERLAEEYA